MSRIVNIILSWIPRNDNLTIELANNFLHNDNLKVSTMTKHVLEQLSTGNAVSVGQKGNMVLSGGVSNYTSGSTIVDQLIPFFEELKNNECLYPESNIICFSQEEEHQDVDITILSCETLESKSITTKEFYW